MSRIQFKLRTVFAVMTLAAIICAVSPVLYRFWQSLSLAATFAVIILPPALGILLMLAALLFAYRRAVTEVNAAHGRDADRP